MARRALALCERLASSRLGDSITGNTPPARENAAMDLAQLLYAYRRPYSWLPNEWIIDKVLFQSRQRDFDMEFELRLLRVPGA